MIAVRVRPPWSDPFFQSVRMAAVPYVILCLGQDSLVAARLTVTVSGTVRDAETNDTL